MQTFSPHKSCDICTLTLSQKEDPKQCALWFYFCFPDSCAAVLLIFHFQNKINKKHTCDLVFLLDISDYMTGFPLSKLRFILILQD